MKLKSVRSEIDSGWESVDNILYSRSRFNYLDEISHLASGQNPHNIINLWVGYHNQLQFKF